MAEEPPLRYVVPIALSDTLVVCPCGGKMNPWNYTQFPSRANWVMWRCEVNSDHVTSALPVPKESNE